MSETTERLLRPRRKGFAADPVRRVLVPALGMLVGAVTLTVVGAIEVYLKPSRAPSATTPTPRAS